MARVVFATIISRENLWSLEYHYSDDHPPEIYGKYPTMESLETELAYRGWTPTLGGRWMPPAANRPISVVATRSCGLSGLVQLDRDISPGVDLLLHDTEHPTMGGCWGFSYAAALSSDDEADLWLRHDPILPLFTGGLFEIECIGHFITRDAAVRAGCNLYDRVKAQLGDSLLRVVVRLQDRKEPVCDAGRQGEQAG